MAGSDDLFASMQKRMAAVQSGQADPGNEDLYGYNQAARPYAKGPAPTLSTQSSTPAPAMRADGTPAPITSAGQVTGTESKVGQTAAQGAPTTVAQSFQNALVNRLNPQAASVNDPSIAPAIQANKLSEQRGMERNRNLLAERAAANGTSNSGGFETGLLGLAQDRAAREGQFAGNAVQHLSDQQNQNATSAAAMAQGLLSGNQANDLQRYGMDLDADLRREGLGAQTSLGQGDLSLRSRLGEGQLNASLLGMLLNNQQFGQQLGQQNSQFGQSLNQGGLLGLLGLL